MVTNLVNKKVNVLSEYVDGHIAKTYNYKTIEAPQTKRNLNQAEQSIDKIQTLPQEVNDVVDGTEQVVDDNKTIDNIIPIE